MIDDETVEARLRETFTEVAARTKLDAAKDFDPTPPRARRALAVLCVVVAVALVIGGIAIAHRDHHKVSVSHETSRPTVVVTRREADANGLHYTLALMTPVVNPGGSVVVQLSEENRTTRRITLTGCGLLGVSVGDAPYSPLSCVDPALQVLPNGIQDFKVAAAAPETLGTYVVRQNIDAALPSVLAQPLTLRVVSAPATTVDRFPCTEADLRGPLPSMPTPGRVTTHINFDVLDTADPAPVGIRARISAADAWNQSFARRDPGLYQIVLGEFWSYSGARTPVLAWIIIGHHVAVAPVGGGPPGPGETSPPRPPCFFGFTFEPVDATTGKSILVSYSSDHS